MRRGFGLGMGRRRAGRGSGLAPIYIVGYNSTAGTSTSLAGCAGGQFALVFARRTTGTTAPALPAGIYDGSLGPAGAESNAWRVAWAQIEGGELGPDGLFSSGVFNNSGRTTIVVLGGAALTVGDVQGAVPATRTTRPFTALPGLVSGSRVIGLSRVGAGTAPLPAGAAELPISGQTLDRIWDTGGPVSSWAPAAAADGPSAIAYDMAVEIRRAA